MNELNEKIDKLRDPLGLRHLDWIEPERDGWPTIRAELEQRKRRGTHLRWLALAASLVIAFGLTLRLNQDSGMQPATLTEPAGAQLAEADDGNLESLIALSQTLEQQLRSMRQGSGPMPADSAVYIAELQDPGGSGTELFAGLGQLMGAKGQPAARPGPDLPAPMGAGLRKDGFTLTFTET